MARFSGAMAAGQTRAGVVEVLVKELFGEAIS